MKKIFSLFLCLVLTIFIVGCGTDKKQINDEININETIDKIETDEVVDDGVIRLTVWGEEDNFSMLEGMIEDFKKQYSNETFEITLTVQSDASLRDVLLTNVLEGPDVFHFPDDQLNSLIAGGVLEKVPNTNTVSMANTSASVDAASLNGTLYAYPMTADNGFFLYYNKDYFTEDDVKTLDGILRVAEKNNKKFQMELNSGWYMYAFFGNVGFEFGLNEDGITNYCNWNTTEGEYTGVDVAQSIVDMIASPAFQNGGDGSFITNAQNGDVIAAISGVWNAIGVKETWGDNYGAVKLPTFTCKGNQVQMSSFTGYKMVGVNSYSKNKEWAHKFAEFITNEKNQTVRFIERNQGPSNIKAAESPEVMKVPAIQAVIAQSEYGVLQRVGNNYWSPCSDFANILIEGNPDNIPLQDLLDTLVEGITALTSK